MHENQVNSHTKGKTHTKNFFALKDSTIMPLILRFRETNCEPVLGLEYVAELANNPYDHQVYVCVLCHVQELKILDHLISNQHTEQYLVS